MTDDTQAKEENVVPPDGLVPLEMRQKWDEILKRQKAEDELGIVKDYLKSLIKEKTFLIGLIIVQNIMWLVILYIFLD